MISDNNAVNKHELLNYVKTRIIELAGSYRKNVIHYLNREEFDTMQKNNFRLSIAPMNMRDDINFSEEKIMQKLYQVLDKPDIQVNDIIELCKEFYIYLIRLGFIEYQRYYDRSNGKRLEVNRSTPVIFNHDFIHANSDIYRRYYMEKENLNFNDLLNQPVTDTSIFDFINRTIQHALSRGDVTHRIVVEDCHSNCHSNHSNTCRSECRGGGGSCRGGCYRDSAAGCDQNDGKHDCWSCHSKPGVCYRDRQRNCKK